MLSNIERAVTDVLAANKEVTVANVLPAYVLIAGFKRQSMEALTAFERAMDKHPDSKDRTDSSSAKLVAELRKNYWMSMFDWGGKQHCCPCCVDLVKQCIDDPDKLEEHLSRVDAHLALAPPSRKTKGRRSKNKRPPRKPVTFDPYGPSTSAGAV